LPEDVVLNNSGKRLVFAGVTQLPTPESCFIALSFDLVGFVLPVGVIGQIEQPHHDVPRRTLAPHGFPDHAREAVHDFDWQLPPAEGQHLEHRHGVGWPLVVVGQDVDPPIADNRPAVTDAQLGFLLGPFIRLDKPLPEVRQPLDPLFLAVIHKLSGSARLLRW
jgi:hypothetical protein